MSCHSIIHNAHCLPFKLTCHFSLVGHHLHSLAQLRSLWRCSSVQFKHALSPGRSFLLHMQLKARVSASPWRTFRCLPADCCLAVHDNFCHPLALSSSLPQHPPPLLSLHCTKALTTLVCICFDIALKPGHCSASAHTPNPLPYIHPPATWPPGRLTAVPPLLPSLSQTDLATPLLIPLLIPLPPLTATPST